MADRVWGGWADTTSKARRVTHLSAEGRLLGKAICGVTVRGTSDSYMALKYEQSTCRRCRKIADKPIEAGDPTAREARRSVRREKTTLQKNCPFCGGGMNLQYCTTNRGLVAQGYCVLCRARGPESQKANAGCVQDAIRLWNERVAEMASACAETAARGDSGAIL